MIKNTIPWHFHLNSIRNDPGSVFFLISNFRSITPGYVCSHEVVNINLKDKPDWFLERNPKGATPTMEIDGQVFTHLPSVLQLPYFTKPGELYLHGVHYVP